MTSATGPVALREHAEHLDLPHEVEDPLKVRVGLGLGGALGAEDLVPVVDTAEEVGLDSLWFAERLGGDQLSPVVAMSVATARTRRLRVGTSATILPGSDPVRTAKDIATLDVVSGGRVIPVFGLVAARSGDRELLRVPRGDAGSWADEALEVMRRLWRGEVVDHEGPHFSYQGLRVGPRTPTSPHLDVWTAGHSAAAIERAGRFADGWLPSLLPASRYAGLARQVLEAAQRAGRGWDLGHFGVVVPYVPAGAGEAAAQVLGRLAARVPPESRAEVVVEDAACLPERIERYVAAGASKFVALPVVSPDSWREEVAWLQETVAAPMRAWHVPG